MRNRLVFALAVVIILGLLAGCQAAAPAAAPTAVPAAPTKAPTIAPTAVPAAAPTTAPTPAPAPTTGPAGPVALVVKGKVAKELSLTKEAFVALGTVKFQAEHPKKGLQDYEGVMFKTLLEAAGADSSAKEVVLTAGDGFAATVAMADLAACDKCALAVQEGGKLAGVFPGMASNAWVKDVVSVEVK